MARTKRAKVDGVAWYRVMSRTNDKRFLFEGGRVKRQLDWMDKTNVMPPRGEVEIAQENHKKIGFFRALEIRFYQFPIFQNSRFFVDNLPKWLKLDKKIYIFEVKRKLLV